MTPAAASYTPSSIALHDIACILLNRCTQHVMRPFRVPGLGGYRFGRYRRVDVPKPLKWRLAARVVTRAEFRNRLWKQDWPEPRLATTRGAKARVNPLVIALVPECSWRQRACSAYHLMAFPVQSCQRHLTPLSPVAHKRSMRAQGLRCIREIARHLKLWEEAVLWT